MQIKYNDPFKYHSRSEFRCLYLRYAETGQDEGTYYLEYEHVRPIGDHERNITCQVQCGDSNAGVENLSRCDGSTFSSSVSPWIFKISPVEKNRQKKHDAEDADGKHNSVRMFSAA